MSRSIMLKKIYERTPGIYLHISFSALFWICAFILVFAVVCVQSVHVTLNPPTKEYPMFIDGKKIVFLGREPQSVTEAREILARFDRKIDDGHRILVPELK